MTWDITIRKVINGYICSWDEDMDDGSVIRRECVFESALNDSDLDSTRDMLLFVKEHFGVYWSKHNAKNIGIEIE